MSIGARGVIVVLVATGLASCTHPAPRPRPVVVPSVSRVTCRGTSRPGELTCRQAIVRAVEPLQELLQTVSAVAEYQGAGAHHAWKVQFGGVIFEASSGPGVVPADVCSVGELTVTLGADSGKTLASGWNGHRQIVCPTASVQPFELP